MHSAEPHHHPPVKEPVQVHSGSPVRSFLVQAPALSQWPSQRSVQLKPEPRKPSLHSQRNELVATSIRQMALSSQRLAPPSSVHGLVH